MATASENNVVVAAAVAVVIARPMCVVCSRCVIFTYPSNFGCRSCVRQLDGRGASGPALK